MQQRLYHIDQNGRALIEQELDTTVREETSHDVGAKDFERKGYFFDGEHSVKRYSGKNTTEIMPQIIQYFGESNKAVADVVNKVGGQAWVGVFSDFVYNIIPDKIDINDIKLFQPDYVVQAHYVHHDGKVTLQMYIAVRSITFMQNDGTLKMMMLDDQRQLQFYADPSEFRQKSTQHMLAEINSRIDLVDKNGQAHFEVKKVAIALNHDQLHYDKNGCTKLSSLLNLKKPHSNEPKRVKHTQGNTLSRGKWKRRISNALATIVSTLLILSVMGALVTGIILIATKTNPKRAFVGLSSAFNRTLFKSYDTKPHDGPSVPNPLAAEFKADLQQLDSTVFQEGAPSLAPVEALIQGDEDPNLACAPQKKECQSAPTSLYDRKELRQEPGALRPEYQPDQENVPKDKAEQHSRQQTPTPKDQDNPTKEDPKHGLQSKK